MSKEYIRAMEYEGDMYNGFKNTSCVGCHFYGGDGCTVLFDDRVKCGSDIIWVKQQQQTKEKDMQNIKVGMTVRMFSKMNSVYNGNGKIGVVTAIYDDWCKVDVEGEIFSLGIMSCTPVKQYTISDTFTPEALLKAESCRDDHFKRDFDILVDHAGGMFFPIISLPAHFYECETMRSKLEGFGFVSEKKEEEKTYKRGDEFYTESGAHVMLITIPSTHNMLFLSVVSGYDKGNRYNSIVVEVSNIKAVTEAELNNIEPGLTLKGD